MRTPLLLAILPLAAPAESAQVNVSYLPACTLQEQSPWDDSQWGHVCG